MRIIFYKVAEVFNLSNRNARERFSFTTVAETRKFLEAYFAFVKKILDSSEL